MIVRLPAEKGRLSTEDIRVLGDTQLGEEMTKAVQRQNLIQVTFPDAMPFLAKSKVSNIP